MLNGRKGGISGAGDPRCKIYIVMGKTNPDAEKHVQQSMILVPSDTPGLTMVRPARLWLRRRAARPLRTVRQRACRRENILLGEGRGFEIAQGRLGPGRIHHCMRQIGAAERALELMVKRLSSRVRSANPSPRNRCGTNASPNRAA